MNAVKIASGVASAAGAINSVSEVMSTLEIMRVSGAGVWLLCTIMSVSLLFALRFALINFSVPETIQKIVSWLLLPLIAAAVITAGVGAYKYLSFVPPPPPPPEKSATEKLLAMAEKNSSELNETFKSLPRNGKKVIYVTFTLAALILLYSIASTAGGAFEKAKSVAMGLGLSSAAAATAGVFLGPIPAAGAGILSLGAYAIYKHIPWRFLITAASLVALGTALYFLAGPIAAVVLSKSGIATTLGLTGKLGIFKTSFLLAKGFFVGKSLAAVTLVTIPVIGEVTAATATFVAAFTALVSSISLASAVSWISWFDLIQPFYKWASKTDSLFQKVTKKITKKLTEKVAMLL